MSDIELNYIIFEEKALTIIHQSSGETYLPYSNIECVGKHEDFIMDKDTKYYYIRIGLKSRESILVSLLESYAEDYYKTLKEKIL